MHYGSVWNCSGASATAFGISLVITLLMLVLYQDDGAQLQAEPASVSSDGGRPITGVPPSFHLTRYCSALNATVTYICTSTGSQFK